MTKAGIARVIDHTLLRPDATPADIERLCREAVQHGFHSVCVAPSWVPLAGGILADSGVKVATVIGFPLGSTFTRVKVFEAMEAVLHGCHELDIVMNIGLAKAGRWASVRKDISEVLSATGGAVHKVIIETCALTNEEVVTAAEIVLASRAEFVKTSTGFGTCGATVEGVRRIRSVVKDRCRIKASGGLRTLQQVTELLDAGADRIGTSSGITILQELA